MQIDKCLPIVFLLILLSINTNKMATILTSIIDCRWMFWIRFCCCFYMAFKEQCEGETTLIKMINLFWYWFIRFGRLSTPNWRILDFMNDVRIVFSRGIRHDNFVFINVWWTELKRADRTQFGCSFRNHICTLYRYRSNSLELDSSVWIWMQGKHFQPPMNWM